MLLSIASVALANTKTDTIVYVKPEVIVEEVKPETETEKIERLIMETWPEEPQLALAIAKAESGLVPTAYNPETHYGRNGQPVCSGSVGIMQIACVHVSDKTTLYDVETNLKKAREIYDESGWRPWGAYTSGAYKRYQ